MKTKISKLIDKMPKNVLLCTISGLLIASVINIYTLKVEIDSIDKIKGLISENTESSKVSHVNSLTDLGYKLCIQSTDLLSKKLENELILNYNLDKLKKEFENSVLSNEFYDTIKGALNVKSNENQLFDITKTTMVAMKNGLIAEFSNVDKMLESKTNTLSWEDYINNSINPQLTRDALDIVLNNKNKIAFIQKSGKVVLQKSNIQDLIDLYIKEGKSVLNDYYFITSSFITEDGDIFGTDDKTFLSANENYKLTVLNTTSVAEVMNLFETEMINIENDGNELLIHIDGYNNLHYISSVVANLILFMSTIGLISVYNKKVNK